MVSTPPEHALRPLKDAGRQSVWLVQRPDEEPRVLKIWGLTPALLLKLGLRIAQPQRQVAGAHRLQRAGIRTPRLIGGWRFGRRQGRRVVEMELSYVSGRSALDLSRDTQLTETDHRPTSASVGDVVAQLISAGLFNRDLKLANLIVDDAGDVWQIDTVGIRPMRDHTVECARMLERLSIQFPPDGLLKYRGVWVPALRHALRQLPSGTRRAVVRWLQAHRRQ